MADKEPTPIRNDLFRFVSIRTPQLIAPEKREIGFVYHPRPQSSTILGAVDTIDIDEARSIVRTQAKSFAEFATLDDIEAIDPALYRFSSWLLRNKNTLTAEQSAKQASGVSILSPEHETVIWDNLFFQILKRTTPSVRQACIQMLVANHFLRMSSKPEIEEVAHQIVQTPRDPKPPRKKERLTLLLRRIAKARVVVPKAFSTAEEDSQSDEKLSTIELNHGQVELFKQHVNARTNARVDSYKLVQQELKFSLAALDSQTRNLGALTRSATASQSLSGVTRQFVSSNPGENVTFEVARALLEDKVRAELKLAAREIGAARPTTTGATAPYCFVASIDDMEGARHVYVTFYLGYTGGFVKSSNYTITFDGSAPISESSVSHVNANIQNGVMLELFPDQELPQKPSATFQLRGNITFNDGADVEFWVEGLIDGPGTHGCATLKTPVDDSPPVDGTPDGRQGVTLFGVNRLGIGVYRKVEQEVCCYVPGEVSRIENILAREYKERHTRSLTSTEVSGEETTEIEVENQSDTVSTTRNELQTEIATELAKDTSIGTGASLGVNAEWPTGSVSADAYFDYANSNSSSASDLVAQSYAQEVVDSALERVLQKTTQKRTSKILKEYEENNRHGFDNREGVNHVTGVYRWVDIIYTNRVINYGKRLMLEFLIPEPARFYKMALQAQSAAASAETADTSDLEEPTPPSENGVVGPTTDNLRTYEDNYLEWGRLYGVTLDDPLSPEKVTLTKSFNPSDDPDGDADPNAKERDYQFDMNFVEFGGDYTKYAGSMAYVDANFDYHLKTGKLNTETGTYFILKVENKTYKYDKSNLADSEGTSEQKSKNKAFDKSFDLSGGEASIAMTAQIKNVYSFSITLRVELVREEQEMSNWQNSVYDAILRAYEDQVAAYEAAVAGLEAEAKTAAEVAAAEQGGVSTNPNFNRTVEQRELKRIAIEMLTKPFNIKMGADFYYSGKCKVPQVEQTAAWRKYSSHVKWFEQCMDWSLMAYLFYPYYWADKCDWVELLQTVDADDPIFEAFLQSGMARVVVPVRRDFEEAVDYYLGTGDIWNGGGLVLDTDDDLYLSVDEELKDPEGFVGREWETRVPTPLTIVQGNSVYLDDEGLPCCDAITEQDVDTKLRGFDGILGETEQNPTPDEEETTGA